MFTQAHICENKNQVEKYFTWNQKRFVRLIVLSFYSQYFAFHFICYFFDKASDTIIYSDTKMKCSSIRVLHCILLRKGRFSFFRIFKINQSIRIIFLHVGFEVLTTMSKNNTSLRLVMPYSSVKFTDHPQGHSGYIFMVEE